MQDTKNTILDVAEDFIRRNGLNAVSYKHISDVVGIKKASIHYHFPQKKDLVNALLLRCEQTYGCEYQSIASSALSAPEKLRKIADVFKQGTVAGKVCLMGVLSSDLTSLDESSRLILEKTAEGTVATYAAIFEQGRMEGSMQFYGSDYNEAYAFFSMLIGAQIMARVKGGAEALQAASDAMIDGYRKN